MNHPDYNSPVQLKNFLEENGMSMQKKFGQNFLVNQSARERIIDLLSPNENELIWEIGPGLGCMTAEILNRKANLTAFEIDRGFIKFLKQFFEDEMKDNKFNIIEGDVLKNWKKEFDSGNNPIKLFGNLPYNIAATFIADTIVEGLFFDRCVFTIQKEVAQRIAALPGSENYSSFSVLCQWGYEVKLANELAAGNFWPRPNVASQTVVLEKKQNPPECKDPKLFVKLVHALFLSRRKTIANNIKSLLPPTCSVDEFFSRVNIDKSIRAEELKLEDFLLLSDVLSFVILE
jgi:16S rRNA (adenine1518-N6/adenine1519-N6)-dimethyltransferase